MIIAKVVEICNGFVEYLFHCKKLHNEAAIQVKFSIKSVFSNEAVFMPKNNINDLGF